MKEALALRGFLSHLIIYGNVSPYASFQNGPLHLICEPDLENTEGQ